MIDSNTQSEETETHNKTENVTSATDTNSLSANLEENLENEVAIANESTNQQNQSEVEDKNEQPDTVSFAFSFSEKESIDKSITITGQDNESNSPNPSELLVDSSDHSVLSVRSFDHSELQVESSSHSEFQVESSDHSEVQVEGSNHSEINSWDTEEDDEQESIISIQCGLFIIIVFFLILGICVKICYSSSGEQELEKVKRECEMELENAKKGFLDAKIITEMEKFKTNFYEKCALLPEEKDKLIASEMKATEKDDYVFFRKPEFLPHTWKVGIVERVEPSLTIKFGEQQYDFSDDQDNVFKMNIGHYVYFYKLDGCFNPIWYVAIVKSINPLEFKSAVDDQLVEPDLDKVFNEEKVKLETFRMMNGVDIYSLIRVTKKIADEHEFKKDDILQSVGENRVQTQNRTWCNDKRIHGYNNFEIIPKLIPRKKKCCCHKRAERKNGECPPKCCIIFWVGLALTICMYVIPAVTNNIYLLYYLSIVQCIIVLVIVTLMYFPCFKGKIPRPYGHCHHTEEWESPYCWTSVFTV